MESNINSIKRNIKNASVFIAQVRFIAIPLLSKAAIGYESFIVVSLVLRYQTVIWIPVIIPLAFLLDMTRALPLVARSYKFIMTRHSLFSECSSQYPVSLSG